MFKHMSEWPINPGDYLLIEGLKPLQTGNRPKRVKVLSLKCTVEVEFTDGRQSAYVASPEHLLEMKRNAELNLFPGQIVEVTREGPFLGQLRIVEEVVGDHATVYVRSSTVGASERESFAITDLRVYEVPAHD